MQEINNEVRAFEIHEKATAYYRASEQFGYKFLMEVKTIRDEKLYKELGYEDFEQYTLGYFGYSRETITNRIKTAETWGTDYVEALRHFGTTKTHQLATMPKTNRSEILERGIPTDNGIKTVEEATTREIEKYQKQLKQQSEQHLRQLAEKDEIINKTYEQLEKAQQQQPKVVEKPVIPEDYQEIKQENEQLKQSNQKLQRDLKWVQDDLRLKQMQYQLLESSTAEAKALKKQIDSLKNEQNNLTGAIEATRDLHQLERDFNDFFDKNMAPIKFKGISQYIGATNAPARIHNLINLAEAWVEEMRKAIPNQNIKIIEGEIIDD